MFDYITNLGFAFFPIIPWIVLLLTYIVANLVTERKRWLIFLILPPVMISSAVGIICSTGGCKEIGVLIPLSLYGSLGGYYIVLIIISISSWVRKKYHITKKLPEDVVAPLPKISDQKTKRPTRVGIIILILLAIITYQFISIIMYNRAAQIRDVNLLTDQARESVNIEKQRAEEERIAVEKEKAFRQYATINNIDFKLEEPLGANQNLHTADGQSFQLFKNLTFLIHISASHTGSYNIITHYSDKAFGGPYFLGSIDQNLNLGDNIIKVKLIDSEYAAPDLAQGVINVNLSYYSTSTDPYDKTKVNRQGRSVQDKKFQF